jgi:hypothetical protein
MALFFLSEVALKIFLSIGLGWQTHQKFFEVNLFEILSQQNIF